MISERGRGARAVFRFAEYGVAAASPPARFATQTARVRPAPTVSPKCAKTREKALSTRFAALNRVRNIAKPTKAAKNGTFFCGSGFQFPRFLSHTAKRRCRYDSINSPATRTPAKTPTRGAHAPYSASRNTALRRLRRPRGLLRKPRACAPPTPHKEVHLWIQ